MAGDASFNNTLTGNGKKKITCFCIKSDDFVNGIKLVGIINIAHSAWNVSLFYT